VNGRKVVGSAQLRHGGALLQHGSIMLEDEQAMVTGLTRGARTDPGTAPAATPLTLLLDRRLGTGEVVEAVAAAAAQRWRGAWKRLSDPVPLLRAAAVHFPQFQSRTWTWAR
jgi:lipoyl(octanoyl) transferase